MKQVSLVDSMMGKDKQTRHREGLGMSVCLVGIGVG